MFYSIEPKHHYIFLFGKYAAESIGDGVGWFMDWDWMHLTSKRNLFDPSRKRGWRHGHSWSCRCNGVMDLAWVAKGKEWCSGHLWIMSPNGVIDQISGQLWCFSVLWRKSISHTKNHLLMFQRSDPVPPLFRSHTCKSPNSKEAFSIFRQPAGRWRPVQCPRLQICRLDCRLDHLFLSKELDKTGN